MIVEDEILIGMDLEDVVKAAGFDPVWVASLQGVLRSIEPDPPAVAILDLVLADGNGLSIVEELRRRGIPFVIYSGLSAATLSGEIEAPRLVKPASPEAIVRSIEAALDGAAGPASPPDPTH